MTITLSMPDVEAELKPRITVVGVGGAGGNAVNNMIESNLAGVEFLVCNTDAQALGQSKADRKIQLGITITQGLGAGARPEIGRAAAEEALEEVLDHLTGCHMVFIAAGMGGGTGTGAAPVIARATREQGILTVGVVTKPFHFEGQQRMRLADDGIGELTQYVDTLIIIPNQNLFRVANDKTTFADAFHMADNVLYSGVRGVTDLMVMPGLINLDFADVRTVMSEMGKAMMGTGEAEGDRRAVEAAEAAISNPLLDDITMEGAKGVLINITGGPDMTLFEVDEAANRIREEVDPDANILFGSTFDQNMEGRLRVSVVATGIDAASVASLKPAVAAVTSVNRIPADSAAGPAAAENAPEATSSMSPQQEAAAESPPAAPDSEAGKNPAAPEVASDAPATGQNAGGTTSSATVARIEAAPTSPQRAPFVPQRPVAPHQGAEDGEPGRGREPESAAHQPIRRRSLFERMTGATRLREETLPRPALGDQAEKTEPRISAPRPLPQAAPMAKPVVHADAEPAKAEPAATPQPTPTVRPAAPQVADAERHDAPATAPAAEPKPAAHEEEVLDIPAFLRRQAN